MRGQEAHKAKACIRRCGRVWDTPAGAALEWFRFAHTAASALHQGSPACPPASAPHARPSALPDWLRSGSSLGIHIVTLWKEGTSCRARQGTCVQRWCMVQPKLAAAHGQREAMGDYSLTTMGRLPRQADKVIKTNLQAVQAGRQGFLARCRARRYWRKQSTRR